MLIRVTKNDWGRLEWSVARSAWDGRPVLWKVPGGGLVQATVVFRREDRKESDHGVPDRFKTDVVYLRLADGLEVPCERHPQEVIDADPA